MLQYAAAALSLVSFITTSNGLTTVLDKASAWQAYLISFGIQAIVLGIGMKLATILGSIWGKNEMAKVSSTVFRRFIGISMVTLYLSAIVFSSFFSFVFLTNHAYSSLRETDYNIEIDSFLVGKTKELKDINDAVGKILQKEIQKNTVGFSTLLDKIKETASASITSETEKVTLNPTQSIPDNELFKASWVTDTIEVDPDMVPRLEQAEGSLSGFATTYTQYYNRYATFFNNLQAGVEAGQVASIQTNLETLSNDIIALIGRIGNYASNVYPYNERVNNSKNSLQGYTEQLSGSVNELRAVYNALDSDDAVTGSDIKLADVYKTIFAPQSVAVENVRRAHETLQNLIAQYLDSNTEAIDEATEGTLAQISTCISYLGEFEKYKTLDQGITDFENQRLNQVYLIQPDKPTIVGAETEETTTQPPTKVLEEATGSINTPEEYEVLFADVNKEAWNKNRREDMAQFIRLVKTLPDIKLLIQLLGSNDAQAEIKGYEDFVTKTLNEAYGQNRSNLENINQVERAKNFLTSKYPYMAWFCIFIAFFMDIASCLVGLFLHYVKEKDGQLTESPPQQSNE